MRTNVATASPDTTGLKIASGAGMPSARQLSGNRRDPQARLGASPCWSIYRSLVIGEVDVFCKRVCVERV
jgi:hypothetical protein